MTPEQEIQRAERARQLLEEPLIKEAFSLVENAFIDGIHRTAVKDSEMREKLCQMLMCLKAVKQHLQSVMESGKLAQAQMNQESLWAKAKNVVGIR